MTRSGFILLAMSIMVVMAATASPGGAQCAACSKEADWSESANAFLEGKPVNETTPLWGPKAARMTNSQFESKGAENADNASAAANSPAETPALQRDLEKASAQPSAVNAGSPVMITAVFADARDYADNRTAFSDAAYNVSAIIMDSRGAEAGWVNLERASGGEYAGIWSGSMKAGLYNVTLVASGSGASRTFDDALQIEVRA